jgi:hypothetical protein
MRFYGIADCKGLEAFMPIVPKVNSGWVSASVDEYKKEIGIMTLRANANRHRHAVVFLADVSADVAGEISDLLDEGEYEEALIYLKDNADSISLARSPGAEKSWGMIPNPDLDPYG